MTAVALLAAVACGGCGGADDTSTGQAEVAASDGGTSLSQVAYSTPELVYQEVVPDFQKTGPGEGVGFNVWMRGLAGVSG